MEIDLLSPLYRVIIPSISAALVGFFTSVLVNEISTQNGILWNEIHKKESLYFAVLALAVNSFYSWMCLRKEPSKSTMTKNQYEGYLRHSLAIGAHQRVQELSRQGKINEATITVQQLLQTFPENEK